MLADEVSQQRVVFREALTPPLSQSRISLASDPSLLAKNQKNNSFLSSGSSLIGRYPAYDSPTSKSTSGTPVPLTANSVRRLSAQATARNTQTATEVVPLTGRIVIREPRLRHLSRSEVMLQVVDLATRRLVVLLLTNVLPASRLRHGSHGQKSGNNSRGAHRRLEARAQSTNTLAAQLVFPVLGP